MVNSLGISLYMGAGGLSKSASAESNVRECLPASFSLDSLVVSQKGIYPKDRAS